MLSALAKFDYACIEQVSGRFSVLTCFLGLDNSVSSGYMGGYIVDNFVCVYCVGYILSNLLHIFLLFYMNF
jgi:hypothetical protein